MNGIEIQVYLFDDLLLYAKIRKDKYKYLGRIYMDRMRIINIMDNSNNRVGFADRENDSSEQILQFHSPQDKNDFLTFSRNAMRQYYLDNQTQLEAEARARRFLKEFTFEQKKSLSNSLSQSNLNSAPRSSSPVPSSTEGSGKNSPNASGKSSPVNSSPRRKTKFEKLGSFLGKDITISDLKNQQPRTFGISATAVVNYIGKTPQELTFAKGDTIFVIDCKNEMWKGESRGVEGLFPSYTVELNHEDGSVLSNSSNSHTVEASPASPIKVSSPTSSPRERKLSDFDRRASRKDLKPLLGTLTKSQSNSKLPVSDKPIYSYEILKDPSKRPKELDEVNLEVLEKFFKFQKSNSLIFFLFKNRNI